MLTINYPAIKHLINKLSRHTQSLENAASEITTLHEEEKSYGKKAIYLKSDLELIKKLAPGRNNTDIQDLDGSVLQIHHPTEIYRYDNVRFINGHLFLDGNIIPVTSAGHNLLINETKQHIQTAFLSTTQPGFDHFGHWLTDDLSLKLCSPVDAIPIRPDYPYTKQQVEYAKYFEHQPNPVNNISIDKMYVARDHGQNNHKKKRYLELRRKLRNSFSDKNISGVIIKRGMTGEKRLLKNENELIDYCVGIGFNLVDPKTMSAKEIVEKTIGAKIILGVEGSQMAHGVYTMSESATMFIIQPPNRFSGIFKHYMDCLGFQYAMAVGEDAGNDEFNISIDKIKHILDVIDQ